MKTILQQIVNALEGGGVNVSAIKTCPPDEDGAVPVSLVIQPMPANEAAVVDFIKDNTIAVDSACEDLDDLYRAYTQFMGISQIMVSSPRFIKIMKRNFPQYPLQQAEGVDGKPVLCFFYMRLIRKEKDGASYSAARQAEAEAAIRREAEAADA